MKIQVLYYTGNDCGVCMALKPKLKSLLSNEFPLVEYKEINIQEQPELAAQNMVFTVPVLLIKIDGKEYTKFIRSFSLEEVKSKLQKPYSYIE